MDQQSHPAKSGTRRMFAVAAIVCLIVVIAVLMRDGDGAVVADSGRQTQNATPAPRVAATPMAAMPTAEATSAPTPTPEATPAAPVANAEAEVPLNIKVRALAEGGCEIAPETEVSFVQIMSGGEETFVDNRALAEVSGENSYPLEWKEGALALAVVFRSDVAVLPGFGFERSVLDRLKLGRHQSMGLQASQIFDPTNALYSVTPGAVNLVKADDIYALQNKPGSTTPTRELNLGMIGLCNATIVLELAADAPHSVIDDVEVSALRGQVYGAYTAAILHPESFGRRNGKDPAAPMQFEQLQGEIKIHPLFPGDYSFRIKTSDSRIWSSDSVKLEAGEEKRIRVELRPAARITARVTGASSPSAEITYRMSGLRTQGDYQPVASKAGRTQNQGDNTSVLFEKARADATVEFEGLPGGQYSILAIEADGPRGNAFVPLRSGHPEEVVIALGAQVPVTVDLVDADGNPFLEKASVSFWPSVPNDNIESRGADPSTGRVTMQLTPDTYSIFAMGEDSRTSVRTSGRVVAPGNGDYYRIVMNRAVPFRGRVVDGKKKPLEGARIFASERPGFGWSAPDSNAVSDARGEFTINVAEGHFVIQANHGQTSVAVPALAPQAEGEVFELEIVSTTIKGVALNKTTREPVADCSVEASRILDLGENPNIRNEEIFITGSRMTRTNDRGGFEITNQSPGLYSLSAHHGDFGYAGFITEIKATDNPDIELLVMEKGATLAGTVVDENGAPIINMAVSSLRTSDGRAIAFTTDSDADTEGNYRLPNLPEGEGISAVFVQGVYDNQPRYFLAHLAEGLSLRDGEVTTYNFTATSAARLQVNVVTADGASVRDAEIRLTQDGVIVPDQGRLSSGPTKTDSNGRIRYRAIPAGTYVVSTQLADGRRAESTVKLATWEYGVVTLKVE
jgi:hypothetical protein